MFGVLLDLVCILTQEIFVRLTFLQDLMKQPQYGGHQKLVINNIGFYFVLAYQFLIII